jgi:hypothetical protein
MVESRLLIADVITLHWSGFAGSSVAEDAFMKAETFAPSFEQPRQPSEKMIGIK